MEKKRKPAGYWTIERCREEALKYNRRVDFKKRGSYHAAKRLGCLDEICSHMNYACTPSSKVDYELHRKIASEYKSRRELRKNHPKAYSLIKRKRWNELLEHMEYIHKPKNYWTKETARETAIKYVSINDFIKNEGTAYEYIRQNGWQKELCGHMFNKKKYWSKKENCIEAALKCGKRTEFYGKFPGAYQRCKRHNWMEEACRHMGPASTIRKRYIYSYEFEDNHVYVGLTCNIEKRKYEHFSGKESSRSQVNRHRKKTGCSFEYKMVYPNCFDVEEAGSKESEAIDFYRENGWIILNKSKAGGLGGCRERNNEKKFYEIVSTCNFYSEIKRKISKDFLYKAINNGWLDKSELIDDRRRNWNKERAFEVAKTCKSLSELRTIHHGLFKYLKKSNFLQEATLHMKVKVPNYKKFTFDECSEECLKYKTKEEFKKKSPERYYCSKNNKWLSLFKTKKQ